MLSIPRTSGLLDRDSERRRLLAWRETLPEEVRTPAERVMGERLVGLVAAWPRGVMALYWPIRGEPDMGPALAELEKLGFDLALPRVRGRDLPLDFGRWRPGQAMRAAGFGVMLPEPFDPVTPTYVVLPCVGFSARGYRLGYGAGYYDRTLAHLAARKIGLAFEGCELAGFTPQAHDQRLDYLLTESRCLTLSGTETD